MCSSALTHSLSLSWLIIEKVNY